MKNKLLKSTLLISLATPIVAIASSCTTSTNTTSTAPVSETKSSGPLNAITKYTITFTEDDGQTVDKWDGPRTVKVNKGSKFYSVEQPTAYKNNRPQTYWINKDTREQITNQTVINGNITLCPYFQAEIQLKNCVSIIALEHTMMNVTHYGTNAIPYSAEHTEGTKPNLLYSTDGFVWNEISGSTISINPGEAIYIRGVNPNGVNHSEYNYSQFTMAGTVHLNGSCMSLIDGGIKSDKDVPVPGTGYCFAKLFENCSGIKVISSDFLPSTSLAPHCYDSMFKGCSNLESFPDYLLATKNLGSADYCYANMFAYCTKLTSISKNLLQATTLSPHCYSQMFRGCTGLTQLVSGSLPSTALAEGCYTGMFRGCNKITSIANDLLPATTLAANCYYGMFADCQELTDLSSFVLPAGVSEGKIANYCYREMFYNCIKLTKAPTLNGKALYEGCYYGMFYNCKLLSAIPTMYSTSNNIACATKCYAYMFYNCESITAGIELKSTTLADSCYRAMFYNCTTLASFTTLPATVMADRCYEEMFYNCELLGTACISNAIETLAPYCCHNMFSGCKAITSTPTLTATAAKESCYKSMFANCSGIKSIGKISLTSLADYACYMMFVDCTGVSIDDENRSLSPVGTKFFYCPSTTGLTDPVSSMFQGTSGYGQQGGYPAVAGKWFYYSAA